MTLEEAYEAYQATLPRLNAARDEHEEAYKATMVLYQQWLRLGGVHKNEEGYGKRDTGTGIDRTATTSA